MRYVERANREKPEVGTHSGWAGMGIVVCALQPDTGENVGLGRLPEFYGEVGVFQLVPIRFRTGHARSRSLNDSPKIQLVVGLGNPGEQYRGSRHNIGFAVVDAIAQQFGADVWRSSETERETAVEIGGRSVVLAQPLTFMNRSGQVVGPLVDRLGLTPSEILVIVDDIDLALGRLRFRRAGGPGTHNGLRDICSEIGEGYPRLRVGVLGGDIPNDLAAYVLSPFPEDQDSLVNAVISKCVESVETAISRDLQTAMNRFNGIRVEHKDVEENLPEALWPLTEVCPQRLAQWVEVEGVVVVECVRPTIRGLKGLGSWLRWWMGPQRIRLDPVGTAIWRQLDGQMNLGRVVEALSEDMPDDREHLVTRVDLFVRTLASQGVLRLG